MTRAELEAEIVEVRRELRKIQRKVFAARAADPRNPSTKTFPPRYEVLRLRLVELRAQAKLPHPDDVALATARINSAMGVVES